MIDDELIHIQCRHCGNVTSIRFGSLRQGENPCPFCGKPLPVDEASARSDAMREATDLDAGPDALGSEE